MFDKGEEVCASDFEIDRTPSCLCCQVGVVYLYISEFLKGESPGALYPLADFSEVVFGVNSRDNRRAEFIVCTALHDDFYAFLKVLDGDIGISGGERVLFRRVFDIHRPEVDKSGFGDASDNIGEGAIGIELHKETERLYLSYKVEEIAVECRLAAGDANDVELALPCLEEF